ncbi:MAG: hypothetical protein RR639_08535 [Hydrogenoanaerobacterium sp.]
MENLKGFLTFGGKEYPFSYSDAKLNLYPSEFDPQSLKRLFAPIERGKKIENIELCGVTAGRKNVIFEVPEQYSDQEGFLSFNVYSIFEYDSWRYSHSIEDGKKKHQTKETKIRGLKFRGLDVDIFYPPEKAYLIETSADDIYHTTVCVKKISAKPLGIITWEGKEISFSAQYTIKQSFSSTPLLSASEIVAVFSDSVDLKFIKDIYWAVYQTLRYLLRRINIVFDSIDIFDINEDSIRNKFGSFYELREQQEKETHTKMKRRVLSYDCIGDKFADLVKSFLDETIYIENLPANIDSTNKFGPDRMLFDFVAFEREYANLYPESDIRSEKYIEAKTVALEAIYSLMSKKSGKVKKYLSSFYKRIDNDENSLSDRLMVVINDCKTILSPFLINELGKEYDVKIDGITPLEDIASIMNTLRNDMAHGNLDIQLDGQHIMGFSIIETILYAMRLKALEIEERRIQEGIIQVMGFNFSLD